MTTLVTLNLSNTPVTDDGLRHLTGLIHLDALDLFGTGVTLKGVKALLPYTEVRTVQLGRTAIADADAAQLRKEFPITAFTLETPL